MFIELFIITIVIIRFGVWLVPEVDMKIGPLVIHHYVFGLLLVGLTLFLSLVFGFNQYLGYVLAIGLGLFIDELGFIMIGGKKDKEYWSWQAISISLAAAATSMALYLYLIQ